MRPLVPIVANQLTMLLLGLVGVKLITKLVPPDVNGFYTLFVSLTQIGLLITHSGITNHASRYWQREGINEWVYARFLWTESWWGLRLLAPIVALTVLVRALMDGSLTWLWLLPLLVFSNLALALNGIGFLALNAARRPWQMMLLSTVGSAARVFLPLGFAWMTTMSLGMLSVGYTLHGILIIGVLLALFHKAIGASRPGAEKSVLWRQELKDYGRPFMFLGVGAWLLQYVDRWIVEQVFGSTQAGLFGVALQLGGIIPTMAVGILMQLYFPGIFRKSDHARTPDDWRTIARECDRITIGFVALTLAGLLTLHFVAPLFTGWLIDGKYAAALPMLAAAGLVMLAAQGNQFYYLLLQGQHNSSAMVKVMLMVAGLKTLVSVVAAAFSWNTFMVWLWLSPLVCMAVGRTMILRLALAPGTVARPARKETRD